MDAENIIEKLNLLPHPEGGYFKEIKRSDEYIPGELLPERYKGRRTFYTSIYYLLQDKDKSHFHKVNSDETWYFHTGSSITIHLLSEENNYSKIVLGNDVPADELPQFTVHRGVWFAAELNEEDSFGLFSCNVAPGFEYDDFELAKSDSLIKLFPNQRELIKKLTIE